VFLQFQFFDTRFPKADDIGGACFGQDNPNHRNPDGAMNDRARQNVEANGADFGKLSGDVCSSERMSVIRRFPFSFNESKV
jgi:hypothetical protein